MYSPVLGSLPAYKELALFYEDYLTVTGKDGNYVFAPSFSPENNPANTSPSAMLVINASMDIAVCREVLGNLIQACELLGTDAESIPKWKSSSQSRNGCQTCSACCAEIPSKSSDNSNELFRLTWTCSPQCSLLKLSR